MIKFVLHTLVLLSLFIGGGILLGGGAYASDCTFNNGNPIEEFKNCTPEIGIRTDSDIDLTVTEDKDFREITAAFIKRVQVLSSIVAIGIIVWIGLILVLPTKADEKEQAKAKVLSVLLGFLAMIAATILINGLINIMYEVFK